MKVLNKFQLIKRLHMLISFLQFLNLIAFGFVTSQPAFYLMAMSSVQKKLHAASYTKL